MAYSVEKDLERMGRRKKAVAKTGKKRQDRIAKEKKGKAKKAKRASEETWVERLKRKTQMLLKGKDYKSPAMKKKAKKK